MRRLRTLIVGAIVAVVLAAPAFAVQPTIVHDLQISQVVQNPTACGDFGVIWRINITADI